MDQFCSGITKITDSLLAIGYFSFGGAEEARTHGERSEARRRLLANSRFVSLKASKARFRARKAKS